MLTFLFESSMLLCHGWLMSLVSPRWKSTKSNQKQIGNDTSSSFQVFFLCAFYFYEFQYLEQGDTYPKTFGILNHFNNRTWHPNSRTMDGDRFDALQIIHSWVFGIGLTKCVFSIQVNLYTYIRCTNTNAAIDIL